MNSTERAADISPFNLADISPERVAMLGDSVLACSLALYRRRLGEDGTVYSAFDSSI